MANQAACSSARDVQRQWDTGDGYATDDDGHASTSEAKDKKQRRHERLKERPRAASDRVLESASGFLRPKMMKAPKLRSKARARGVNTNAARIRRSIQAQLDEMSAPLPTPGDPNAPGASPTAAPAPAPKRAAAPTRVPPWASSVVAFFHAMGARRWMVMCVAVLFLVELTHWRNVLVPREGEGAGGGPRDRRHSWVALLCVLVPGLLWQAKTAAARETAAAPRARPERVCRPCA